MSKSRTYKAALLSLGQALTTMIGLILAAVMARMLSTQDYATYRQTILAYTFAAPFLTLGLPKALFYFLPGEEKRTRAILLENVGTLTILGLVFSLFLLFGGNHLLAWRFNNPDLVQTLQIYAPYALFFTPASALSACLIARDRVHQVALFTVGSRLAVLFFGLGAGLILRTPHAVLAGTAGATAITGLVAILLMLKATDQGERKPTWAGVRTQLSFSIPMGIGAMLAQTFRSLDKVLIAAFFSAEVFAIYVNGAINLPLVPMILGSVTSILMVDLARWFKEGDLDKSVRLWQRACEKCACILLPTMVFCLIFANEIMVLLYGAPYEASAIPFRIYLLVMPLRIVSWDAMLMAAKKTRVIMIRSGLGLVLNLVLSLALMQVWGYLGPAIATLIVLYLIHGTISLPQIARLYQRPIRSVLPWRSIGKILLISGVAAACTLNAVYAPIEHVWIRTAVRAMAYFISLILLLQWQGYLNISALMQKLRKMAGKSSRKGEL